ncbi:MAG: hypothetical protein KDA89_22955, partial [Planctomycetaceae bacterium]|nr:hypothetical protein [Planctomycetaceae bacterium]
MSSNETGIENPFLSPQMPPVPDVPAAKSSPFAWVFRGAAAVIILVLLLLLLMPVHRGRQPALRTQCKNNL